MTGVARSGRVRDGVVEQADRARLGAMLRSVLLAAALTIGAIGALPAAHADSAIKDDESVVLFTTTAHKEGAEWVVPVHGWIFELEPDSVWRGVVHKSFRAALGRDETDAEAIVLRERLGWFLADSERGKEVDVEAGGVAGEMPDSGKDGHFRGELRIPVKAASGDRLAIGAVARDGRRFAGTIALLDGPGLAVISDIDDTVKVTEVIHRKRMLTNTFLREFVAVDGMAALYGAWARAGLPFFYVSGSPWQLYVPLVEFLARSGFPAGELALREFRLKDDRRWSLLEKADRHKLAAIRDLLTRFPARRFVLIGDAAERDPEIYGVIARESPDRIERILIRRVAGDRMTKARWQKALGSAAGKALEFDQPGDLPAAVRALK